MTVLSASSAFTFVDYDTIITNIKRTIIESSIPTSWKKLFRFGLRFPSFVIPSTPPQAQTLTVKKILLFS